MFCFVLFDWALDPSPVMGRPLLRGTASSPSTLSAPRWHGEGPGQNNAYCICSIFFNGIHFCFQRFKIARNSRMCLEGSKDDIVRRTNIRSMENEGFYLRHMADACRTLA